MGLRVGIPRALWYYSHFPFWRTFLEGLGARVVASPPTSREIVDAGVADTVSEACVPIKVFMGHVRALVRSWEKRDIDAIFLPRYVNWCGSTVYCPKFLGLPDMVRHSFSNLPLLIQVRLDRRQRPLALLRACNQVRRQLGAPLAALLGAYRQAVHSQRRHEKNLQAGWTPVESIAGRRGAAAASGDPPIKLALLGYPYLIYDRYINLGLMEKLQAAGVEVLTADIVPGHCLRQFSGAFYKTLFWTYSDLVARAGCYFLGADRDVDGIIHVTAFGCGPDAMVDKLLELRARQAGRPFLSVTLDEHSGEAGILTRLEAFVDMLRRRRMPIALSSAGGTSHA